MPNESMFIGRKALLFFAWLFWLLLLVAAVLLSYGWTHRYEYLEQTAKHILAEKNIAGELSIIAVGRSELRLENIVLKEVGGAQAAPFFTADIIEARYNWRDALEGKIEALTFTRPKAVIEIDETGKMIGGWVPPTQSSDSSDRTFPKDGLVVKDGHVTVKSPYGEVGSSLSAALFDSAHFEVDLYISPAKLSHEDMSLIMDGPVSVKAKEGGYHMITDVILTDFTAPTLNLQRASIGSDLSLAKTGGRWVVNGPLSFEGEEIRTDAFTVSALSLETKGKMSVLPQSEDTSVLAGFGYNGDVDIAAQRVTLNDKDTCATLAKKLSFYDILQKSPILRDFSPALREQVRTMLSGTNIDAKLAVQKQGEALRVTARDELMMSRGNSEWIISPASSGPLVDIQPHGHEISYEDRPYKGESHFSVVKSAPLPLLLTQSTMKFGLTSEGAFDTVSHFTGQVHLPDRWRMTGPEGHLIGLSVGSADMSFERVGEDSEFKAVADFNLTGVIPGGYVTELGGTGDVVIDRVGESSRLKFTASEAINYKQMDLTSGWILEDGQLSLARPVLMVGPPERRKLEIAAKDLTMRIHDNDRRDFDVDIAAIEGTGLLHLKPEGLMQAWDFDVTDGHMTSEDFPIEDTDIFTPNAMVKANLTEGQPAVFDIESPVMRVSSALVSTDEIAVHMSGTSDNLVVDYDATRFIFSDPSLPEIPMVGQTRLVGTQWTGESIARLPEDPETPIDISFIFEDGVGQADVNIDALNFTEKGLQPQNLVQNLRGKIAAVNGTVSTAIKLEFGEGRELKSYGTATFNSLDFGVLAGTVDGLNGELEFTSFFPLETSGRQTLKLSSFDPGFPLPDGEIEFELLPGKMKIHRAEWDLGDGSIFIEPLVWDFTAVENRAVLAVDNVSLQNFIRRSSDSKLEITGAVSGRLPILVSGVQVNVEKGKLSVPDGGVIRFNHAATDLAGAQEKAVGVAFDALKHFEYDAFELDMNGPLDGLVRLRAIFSGSNQDVYEGQPFEFDVEIEGELMNLMRNLNPNVHRQNILAGVYNGIEARTVGQGLADP